MRIHRFIICLIFSLLFVPFSKGQNTSEDISSWKLYKEISGLQIFSKEIGCHDFQNGIHEKYIVFQFVNTTDQTLIINWQKELWYDNKCISCDKPANTENSFKIELTSGESVEGSCDKSNSSGLKIFNHFINTSKGSKLTKFEFKNMEITFK